MESVVGGSKRCAATLAGAVVLLMGFGVAEAAQAGSYGVFQCSPWPVGSGNPGSDSYVDDHGAANFSRQNSCGNAIGVHNASTATQGQDGRWTWSAPPGTAITRASLLEDLRNSHGYSARIFTSAHGDILVADANEGWQGHGWNFGSGVGQFGVRLVCASGSGCNSNGSTHARAYLRDVTLTLRDSSPPTPRIGGELMSSTPSTKGWQRGNRSLSYDASDHGGGVAAYGVTVNGQNAGTSSGACQLTNNGYGRLMRPCSPEPSGRSANGNTVAGPWRNGTNTVRMCAWDFGGGSGSSNSNCTTRQVKVDNEIPDPAFRNAQNPADPELIRAPVDERFSGVEAGKVAYKREGTNEWHELPTVRQDGELRARVNSEAVPAGRYDFKAWAEDEAGNRSAEVATRENGHPMTLRFPLRADTQLRAGIGNGALKRTIKYGRSPEIRGRLVSADRDPLALQTVKVHEQYAIGSLETQHTHEAVTDKDGRFALRLPAGPSRDVDVTYPGSKRFRPAGARELGLKVRSGVKFNTSRKRVPAGQSVTFGGTVEHHGTQIPTSGKLVELQVREGARKWETVGQAFSTRGDGKYSTSYRFGNFYNRPVRFRFRVKVTRENGWPYKAPVRSRGRRVTVVP
jgi:hypothetical protein